MKKHTIVTVNVNNDFDLMVEKEVYDAIVKHYEKNMATKDYPSTADMARNMGGALVSSSDECRSTCAGCNTTCDKDAVFNKAIELMEEIEREGCQPGDPAYITETYRIHEGDLGLTINKSENGCTIEILHGETHRLLSL